MRTREEYSREWNNNVGDEWKYSLKLIFEAILDVRDLLTKDKPE